MLALSRIPRAGHSDRVLGVITAYQVRWDGRRKRGYLPAAQDQRTAFGPVLGLMRLRAP